jgi:NAD(P)-dependent dehydrogenase (short-subunit alcohol dehydrogenase family)
MDRLKGKTALVVGAGSIGPGWGNGKATAVTFAREGAQVFCVDRNSAAAEETARIIASEGGKATAFTSDVSRAGDVEAMVAACLKTYGRIDVLDNNVGIAETGNVVEVSEADWDRVFAVNLKSAYLAMKHVIPVMARQGGGSIINISSIASIRHLGISYVSYATTKAAMNQMTRTTAVEFAARHIRVNAILPGLMKTPMVEHSAGPCGELCRRRRRGDVARARRAGADGAHGGSLGCGECGVVSRLRRIEVHHRHRAGGRWRRYAEGELSSIFNRRHSGTRDFAWTRNPCSRWWLWIPVSLVSLALRNDSNQEQSQVRP